VEAIDKAVSQVYEEGGPACQFPQENTPCRFFIKPSRAYAGGNVVARRVTVSESHQMGLPDHAGITQSGPLEPASGQVSQIVRACLAR